MFTNDDTTSNPVFCSNGIFVVAGTPRLNVMESTNEESDVICTLNQGDELLVTGSNKGWAHVYTSAGIEGYVTRDHIRVK